MKTHFFAVVFLLLAWPAQDLFCQSGRLKPETKIIEQPGAPVKITSYSAAYQAASTYSPRNGIEHSVAYQNTTDRLIVAVAFGLVSFDVWNEYLDRLSGISTDPLKPQGKSTGEWESSSYADFSFHTGIAYVSRVRFEDGEIWEADTKAILNEMRKIEKDFDASRLKPKTPPEK
jgi:hypothetical protein